MAPMGNGNYHKLTSAELKREKKGTKKEQEARLGGLTPKSLKPFESFAFFLPPRLLP